MELTNQEGMNWFLNQNRLLKSELEKLIFQESYHKPLINQYLINHLLHKFIC